MCYTLKICLSPNSFIKILKPNSMILSGRNFWKSLVHKNRIIINVTIFLKRGAPHYSPFFMSCVNTKRNLILATWRIFLTRISTSNKSLLFKPPSLCNLWYQPNLNWLRQGLYLNWNILAPYLKHFTKLKD